MADEQANVPPSGQANPQAQEHKGIMEQSLADILQNNAEAQKKVMQAMNITPEQLQEMLKTAENNDLMHTKIKDLFSSGFITKALANMGKVTPQQMQQIGNTGQNAQGQEIIVSDTSQQIQKDTQTPQASSFFQKLKGIFK